MIAPDSHPPVTQALASQQRLARACGTGDPVAWAAVVHLHGRRLLTLAYWLSGSREVAEGAVTETFAAAARAWERPDLTLPLAVWLARTCYERTERAPSAPGGRPAEAAAFLDPAHHDIADDLVGLPFELRAAVVLRCVVGFDVRDAARIMDLPRAGFEQRLRQGLALLRASPGDGFVKHEAPLPRPVGRGLPLATADALRTLSDVRAKA